MATLVPCPACARHVRANEATCPFCDATIGEVPERVLAPISNDRLFARAALTFAAAAATTLTACGKEPTDKPPPAPTNTSGNAVAPAYGVPAVMADAAPEPAPTTTTQPTASAPPSATPSARPGPSAKPPPRPTGGEMHTLYGVPPINKN
jgi:hypothetical protein